MSISILRLLVDFGLLVLIWVVQLIVYPSFLFYNKENLITWHRKYTPLVGYIVAPLMVLQLSLSIYQISNAVTLNNIISVMMISTIWIITFLQFVPIHNNISNGSTSEKMLLSLVKKNWLRTFLWSLLFVLNVITFDKA